MQITVSSHQSDNSETMRYVTIVSAALFATLFVRTAWVTDDAYITFRTIDNMLHGFGLRWNVSERVQTYTHPLWMLTMLGAASITREFYYTSIALSIGLSLLAVVRTVRRIAIRLPMCILVLSLFALSKSFVDFSTSGLEDALTYALLVMFFIAERTDHPNGKKTLHLSLIAALIMLNRLDVGLLVLPTLVSVAWYEQRARGWRPLIVGMLPLLAWELFALVYYGFPFPNTAYAKLRTGIPLSDSAFQGVLYFLYVADQDPLTLFAIAVALISPIFFKVDRRIPAGLALYLAYVLWVGGDFMSGRFLAAPFVCAVVWFAGLPLDGFGPEWLGASAVIWLLGLTAWPPVILSDATFGANVRPEQHLMENGVNEERQYYYPFTGLLTARRDRALPNHRWYRLGLEARTLGRMWRIRTPQASSDTVAVQASTMSIVGRSETRCSHGCRLKCPGA